MNEDNKITINTEQDPKTYKLSFFQRFKMALIDPYFGNIAVSEKVSKSFAYYFKLLLILSLIIGMIYYFQISAVISSISQTLRDDLPDFKIENNQIEAFTQMPHKIESNDMIIIVDTDDNTRMVDLRPTTTVRPIILVNSTKIEYYNPTDNTYPFGDKFELSSLEAFERFAEDGLVITKDELINTLSSSNLITLFMSLFGIVAFIFHKLIAAIYLYLFARIFSVFKRIPIRSLEVLSIVLYSLTVPSIIHMLASVLGIQLPLFNWIFYGIGLYFVSRFYKNLQFIIKVDNES